MKSPHTLGLMLSAACAVGVAVCACAGIPGSPSGAGTAQAKETARSLLSAEPAKAFALAFSQRAAAQGLGDADAAEKSEADLAACVREMGLRYSSSAEKGNWEEALLWRGNLERCAELGFEPEGLSAPRLESESEIMVKLARSIASSGDTGRALLWYERSFSSGDGGAEILGEAWKLAAGAKNVSAQRSMLARMGAAGLPLPPGAEGLKDAKLPFNDMMKGVCTIWVNKGLKMENGVAVPDRVIGSGFFIDPRGYLLTNYHVISSEVDPEYEGYSRLYVRLSGSKEERIPAKVVGWDKNFDMALLKVPVRPEYVFSVSKGRDFLPGDRIYAIGSPVGLENTITSGIVSAVGRDVLPLGDAIQVDVPVNPGNSGGPLLDENGDLAGIVFAGLLEYQGLNFAIPLSWISQALDGLYSGGAVSYGFSGLAVREEGGKVIVSYALYGSGARRAGIEPGDAVLAVNGIAYARYSDLGAHILKQRPGSLAVMEIERDGRRMTMAFALDAKPDIPLARALGKDPQRKLFPAVFGMEVEESGANLFERTFRVLKVYPGDIADESGLSQDDPFALRSWKADLKAKTVTILMYVKKRKQGFLESLMQLTAPMQAARFI
jgi:S1-C subfamily serine protease